MSTPEYPRLPETPLRYEIEDNTTLFMLAIVLSLILPFLGVWFCKVLWTIFFPDACMFCKKSSCCHIQEHIQEAIDL